MSAPAGYGKSTLVSSWLDALDEPSAWLSLDEQDDDLRQFLSYVIAAVQTVSGKTCRESAAILSAPEMPPASALAGCLGNDLEAIETPFVLVIDDYHRVHEQAIHSVLSQLLQHPPRSLHLVLITRRDPPLPLAGLRARSSVVEIREEDLRFSREETRTVLQKMVGISVTDETLSHLHGEIEGWIVGLRLAGLALRNQADPEGYLAQLHGGTQSIQQYLLEEVLKHEAPDFQQWLLRTSILNRFCAPLCEVVCLGDAEATHTACTVTGETFLRDLETANLFSIRLDAQGEWFRYHHLFQQLLRRLLSHRATPEEIRALHGRASRWFASKKLIDEALEHAMAAGEVDHAADIVEAHRLEILNADRWPVLAGWLSQLPEEVVWRRPELLLGEAWLAYYRFNTPALIRIVKQLDELLGDGCARPAWEGELSMFKSFLCYWQGQAQEMLTHVGKARDTLPATHELMRADSEIYFGLAHHMAGQKEVAIDALTKRIREQPEQEGLLLTRQVITLAFIHLLAGGLKESALYSRQLGQLARTWSPVYIKSWSTYLLGCCHFQSGDWQEAERCFRWMADNRYIAHTAAVMSSLTGLGLSLHFMGRSEESAEVAQLLLDFAVETKDPGNLALAESGHARIRLLRGDAEGVCPSSEAANIATAFVFIEAPQVTHCRLLVARGSKESVAQAVEVIERLQDATETIHNTFHLIDLIALKAVAFHELERFDDAEKALEHALELAAPGGWVRPFIELGPPMAGLLAGTHGEGRVGQIERILEAFAEQKGLEPAPLTASPPSGQPLVEPLTNRELDVLELLAERLYDKEIADKLSVSIPTVKTHLRHIYEKLAVGNRRQAVEKAEQLGVLGKR